MQSILNTFRARKKPPLPFERLFELFRLVLAGNNKAIELITDMGDTLGGDYLFDITYIRRAYAELSEAIKGSLMNFEELTRQRYAGLPEAFLRIDSRIRQMISDAGPAGVKPVLFYEDISWDMASAVGGKNAHLAELRNDLNLLIPDAFVITVQAFEELIQHNRLAGKISRAGSEAQEADAGKLSEEIMHAELPTGIDAAIGSAIDRMKARCGENSFLSVRSSAEEEDGDYSFAGQFETVLNVPLEKRAVIAAYKRVIASLFSPRSITYQKQIDIAPNSLKMAVGCMLMIDPACSGVVYTAPPSDRQNVLLISASWGLGTSVVDGSVDADQYVIEKTESLEIKEERIGTKESMCVNRQEGGILQAETPDEMRHRSCLTAPQIKELALLSIQIERYYGKPQDVEWAIDRSGKIFILQSRPLQMQKEHEEGAALPEDILREKMILMKETGMAVQRGVGSGRVFLLRHMDELARFPKGAVLVSKYDSSNFIRIMPYAAAILTDTGSPASHMASLCREFRVPTAVNTKNATGALRHGQEVTVAIDDEGRMTVYEGIVPEMPGTGYQDPAQMEKLYEYRKKRYILKHIAPLNLIDPLQDNFTVTGCRTLHDLLRFIHEKSVMELVEKAQYGSSMVTSHAAHRLRLPIPAGIILIDIGGGVIPSDVKEGITLDQVACEPLRGIIQGMLYPGIWRSDAVVMKANDLISSMMRMPDITTDNSELVGYNIAVVSREYVHFGIRFGYHFSTIDCYCSDTDRNNHIYFRFAGGATDITKRSRRIQLIAEILKEYGFTITAKGDVVICRLSNLGRENILKILDQLGRLLSFTRQLDAVLHDDAAVRHYADKFLAADYAV